MPPIVIVTSRRPPAIIWRCPACHRPEIFDNSLRFRANANGKLIDVWMIYRCRRCDTTKNVTLAERTPVRHLPPDLLRAAEDNDAATARRLARDVALLRRAGVVLADGDEWDVAAPAPVGCARIVLAFPEPLLVRLDTVVAGAIGAPRRVVGPALVLPPGSPRADRLRLWSDVEVALDR